jgi:hypothetical protein
LVAIDYFYQLRIGPIHCNSLPDLAKRYRLQTMISEKQRIYIFGASGAGKRALDHFRNQSDVEILGWIDNDIKKHGTFFLGLEVFSAEEAIVTQFDKIWVASTFHREIRLQLRDFLKVPSEKFQNISMTVKKGFGDFSDQSKLKLAWALLKKVNEVMLAHSLPYFLDHGTLLGIIRDKSLLPWDNDIDLAIPASEVSRIHDILSLEVPKFHFSMCESNGWALKALYGVIEFPNEKKTVLRLLNIYNANEPDESKQVVLDLIVKYPYEQRNYWMVETLTLSTEALLTEDICRTDISGVSFAVPLNSDGYLTALYQDWRTPVKEWDHTLYSNLEHE